MAVAMGSIHHSTYRTTAFTNVRMPVRSKAILAADRTPKPTGTAVNSSIGSSIAITPDLLQQKNPPAADVIAASRQLFNDDDGPTFMRRQRYLTRHTDLPVDVHTERLATRKSLQRQPNIGHRRIIGQMPDSRQ